MAARHATYFVHVSEDERPVTSAGNGCRARPRTRIVPCVTKAATLEKDAFAEAWNGLDKADRRRIRRLVRIGQPVENADEVPLAIGFSEYQQSRPWLRLFWFWFVPALLIGMVAAFQLHPIVVGFVLGGGAQAVMARRNVRRAAKVNAAVSPDVTD